MRETKNDLLSNNDSKPQEESVTLSSNANSSVSQVNEESKEEIVKVISDKPIAPLTFLKNNKRIIGLNQPQFKEWLRLKYIAFCGNGNFIPTDISKKQGLMISENEYTLKLKPMDKNSEQLIDISVSCKGKLTKQGQEYILDLIESEQKNND